MFTSINNPLTETDEQIPHSSLPWVWVGFLFAFAFFVLEILFVALDLEERGIDRILTVILIGGWIYWLVCIHRIHKILAELTGKTACQSTARHHAGSTPTTAGSRDLQRTSNVAAKKAQKNPCKSVF